MVECGLQYQGVSFNRCLSLNTLNLPSFIIDNKVTINSHLLYFPIHNSITSQSTFLHVIKM